MKPWLLSIGCLIVAAVLSRGIIFRGGESASSSEAESVKGPQEKAWGGLPPGGDPRGSQQRGVDTSGGEPSENDMPLEDKPDTESDALVLFLGGDVMTGRGIDQILPHAGNPAIYEPYMQNANGYIELAERVSGPIKRPVSFSYIWGDALAEMAAAAPDAKIINLETSVTKSDDYWKGKGIQYRMHPANIRCLTEAGIDCCSLANNHVLDWGYSGLDETLGTLKKSGIKTAGAGHNLREAEVPAIIDLRERGRIVVFAMGFMTSGIPSSWAASGRSPGVNLLDDLSEGTAERFGQLAREVERENDILVASIHWGGNWGYGVPPEHRRFARALVDRAGFDVVHGHSSHHPKPIEVYKDRPIFYGCGDLLNDYEGIGGYEQYRSDLSILYFVVLEPSSGALQELRMTPMHIRRFQLAAASEADSVWLAETLNRECERFGTRVIRGEDGRLQLMWN